MCVYVHVYAVFHGACDLASKLDQLCLFLCLCGVLVCVFTCRVRTRWAQLPSGASTVHKAVVNIGDRPTLDDGREATVEVHIMHDMGRDFYGEMLHVVLTGFLRCVECPTGMHFILSIAFPHPLMSILLSHRPEIRFDGIPQLVRRIRRDVAISKYALDEAPHQLHRAHPLFDSTST